MSLADWVCIIWAISVFMLPEFVRMHRNHVEAKYGRLSEENDDDDDDDADAEDK